MSWDLRSSAILQRVVVTPNRRYVKNLSVPSSRVKKCKKTKSGYLYMEMWIKVGAS